MCVGMYVCMYACMHIYTCICMYVCKYVCMYVSCRRVDGNLALMLILFLDDDTVEMQATVYMKIQVFCIVMPC